MGIETAGGGIQLVEWRRFAGKRINLWQLPQKGVQKTGTGTGGRIYDHQTFYVSERVLQQEGMT
jgi:hypothetical protein